MDILSAFAQAVTLILLMVAGVAVVIIALALFFDWLEKKVRFDVGNCVFGLLVIILLIALVIAVAMTIHEDNGLFWLIGGE